MALRTGHSRTKLSVDRHGVHWPDIDEDLSVEGMFHGVPARPPKK